MPAILFGSISTLVDSSEIQRRAFNEAFAAHGLDWNWSLADYQSMLDSNGGAQRITDFAKARGEADVDAAAVHATKSTIFQELLASAPVEARPGVVDIVRGAKSRDLKLGFVTTTSRANVDAVLTALSPEITAEAFDVIVDVDSVDDPKPAAAAYAFALTELGEDAGSVVAIEDNEGGVASAVAAGLTVIAFPNQNTAGGDFSAASQTVDALDADRLLARSGS